MGGETGGGRPRWLVRGSAFRRNGGLLSARGDGVLHQSAGLTQSLRIERQARPLFGTGVSAPPPSAESVRAVPLVTSATPSGRRGWRVELSVGCRAKYGPPRTMAAHADAGGSARRGNRGGLAAETWPGRSGDPFFLGCDPGERSGRGAATGFRCPPRGRFSSMGLRRPIALATCSFPGFRCPNCGEKTSPRRSPGLASRSAPGHESAESRLAIKVPGCRRRLARKQPATIWSWRCLGPGSSRCALKSASAFCPS